MQFIDILQDLQTNFDSLIGLMNKTSQTELFLMAVSSYWNFVWSTPFQMVLTKWGFCFSFNLMPLSQLLFLDR